MVSLTVLVPAYNEEKTLEQSLNRLMELKIISQIIFVDDGSSDNTLKIANELAKKDPRLLILNQKTNYGKGKALIVTKKHITSETDGDIFVEAKITAIASGAPDLHQNTKPAL